MPDFKNGKIYVIICNETGERYFGSTAQPLSKRLSQHQKMYKYCKSQPIIKRGDYDMVLLEDYPCNSLSELMERENYYIKNNKCLNEDTVRPRRKAGENHTIQLF